MDILNVENKSFGLSKFTKNSINDEERLIAFDANVEFGMPSKECVNFGICRIDPVKKIGKQRKKAEGCKSKTFYAKITHYDASKTEMTFPISQIGAACRVKYFKTQYFKVEEDYKATLQVGPDKKIINVEIKKGDYLIKRTDTAFTVIFT